MYLNLVKDSAVTSIELQDNDDMTDDGSMASDDSDDGEDLTLARVGKVSDAVNKVSNQ